MAESLSFPGDLAECHRLMAQRQALFAVMEQQHAEQLQQHAEQLQQHAEQLQRYIDLEQVLDRTAQDFDQLREDHQKAIDELRLLRRWIYGSRRERHVADARQQHLFEMGELFAEPVSCEEEPVVNGVAPAEDAAQAAAAQEKAARRRKKRADRKL